MKYMLTLDGKRLLLNHEQVEKIVAVVDGSEMIQQEYVGSGQGENGSAYISTIDRPKLSELFSLTVMSDVEYLAMVTFTEARRQAKQGN